MQLLDQTVDEGGSSVVSREGTVPVNWLPEKLTLLMELPLQLPRSTLYPHSSHSHHTCIEIETKSRPTAQYPMNIEVWRMKGNSVAGHDVRYKCRQSREI